MKALQCWCFFSSAPLELQRPFYVNLPQTDLRRNLSVTKSLQRLLLFIRPGLTVYCWQRPVFSGVQWSPQTSKTIPFTTGWLTLINFFRKLPCIRARFHTEVKSHICKFHGFFVLVPKSSCHFLSLLPFLSVLGQFLSSVARSSHLRIAFRLYQNNRPFRPSAMCKIKTLVFPNSEGLCLKTSSTKHDIQCLTLPHLAWFRHISICIYSEIVVCWGLEWSGSSPDLGGSIQISNWTLHFTVINCFAALEHLV